MGISSARSRALAALLAVVLCVGGATAWAASASAETPDPVPQAAATDAADATAATAADAPADPSSLTDPAAPATDPAAPVSIDPAATPDDPAPAPTGDPAPILPMTAPGDASAIADDSGSTATDLGAEPAAPIVPSFARTSVPPAAPPPTCAALPREADVRDPAGQPTTCVPADNPPKYISGGVDIGAGTYRSYAVPANGYTRTGTYFDFPLVLPTVPLGPSACDTGGRWCERRSTVRVWPWDSRSQRFGGELTDFYGDGYNGPGNYECAVTVGCSGPFWARFDATYYSANVDYYVSSGIAPRYLLVEDVISYYSFDARQTWYYHRFALVEIPWEAVGVPTAAFTAAKDTTVPGRVTVASTSADSNGRPTYDTWDFGDGGTGEGRFTTHDYAKPGTYTIALTSRADSGQTATTTQQVTIAAPTLSTSVEILDASPPLKEDSDIRVRVTASASADGVGDLSNLAFADASPLRISPTSAFTLVAGPDPAAPDGAFSLAPGATRTWDYTLHTGGPVGRYVLSTTLAGKDAAGADVSSESTSPGEIGQSIAVDVTVDPATFALEEDASGPKPRDVTVTETITNTTAHTMTEVTLRSLEPQNVVPGQLRAVSYTSGAYADPVNGTRLADIPAGQKITLTAVYTVTDDATVDFTSVVSAVAGDGSPVTGSGKGRMVANPHYLLDFSSRVVNPPSGLLPAGELIRVAGRVTNLSTTATVEVGPVYPTTKGNTGVMSLAWNTTGSDPKGFDAAGTITLAPGESRDFSVRVLTSYSDPRIRDDQPAHSGGTFAELRFTPWGIATHADGSVEDVTPDKIRTTDADLNHRVGIDDSISIPPSTVASRAAVGTAFAIGGVEGLWSGTVNTVSQFVDLVKAPYTVTNAIAEYQLQVWDSFSDAEKDALAENVAYMAVDVLMRNAELGKKGSAALFQAAKANSLKVMQEAENNWQVGDYTSTVQLYTSWSADQVTQIVAPIAFGKLLTSASAAESVQRAQAALQERMAPLLQRAGQLRTLVEIAPALSALESGTGLTAAEVSRLYGISEAELVELQRLATKYDFLLTVRSRAVSSLEWLQKGAREKPQELKIKGVSELDVKLGYPADSLGSLVFQKPVPLTRFEQGQGDLGTLINDFVQSRGFVEGTVDWQNAVARVGERLTEWTKWEKKYKYWNERGWLETTFDTASNDIPTSAAPNLASGRYEGFRLVSTGDEQYVVEMLDGKTGQYRRVTGDIDPIAFTHLDGSPLTVNEHAALLQEMANSPLLKTQHGESATFTQGGLDFIASQFKPGEPGLQIAPGQVSPRIVRFDAAKSDWRSPSDYHLWWDGGFTYSGSYIPRGATPLPSAVISTAESIGAPKPMPLPASVDGGPNVGRLTITFGTAPEAVNAYIDVKGKIVNLAGDGKSSVPSPLQDDAFTGDGTPPRTVVVKPVTGLIAPVKVGQTELPIPEGDPWLAQAGGGLHVGDTVIVGVGTDHAESHRIVAFGSIIIESGLQYDHEAGELIMVVKAAPASSSAASQGLAATGGGEPTGPLAAGALLVLAGTLLVVWRRRRSTAPR